MIASEPDELVVGALPIAGVCAVRRLQLTHMGLSERTLVAIWIWLETLVAIRYSQRVALDWFLPLVRRLPLIRRHHGFLPRLPRSQLRSSTRFFAPSRATQARPRSSK